VATKKRTTTTPRRISSKDRALPSLSSIELRIFDTLREARSDVVSELEGIFKDAINVGGDGREYGPQNAGFLDHSHFHISIGESQINGNFTQTTARIRFTAAAYGLNIATMSAMEYVRRRLIEKGYEAYWSCGLKKDNRAMGLFSFVPNAGVEDTLDDNAAGAWVTELCEGVGHKVEATFGSFQQARGKPTEPSRQVGKVSTPVFSPHPRRSL